MPTNTPTPLLFAPVLLVFEIVQIVVAERYLGVKRIQKGIDPKLLDMRELVAFFWTAGIVATWLWMFVMLSLDVGKAPVACMLIVSLIGYSVRRSCHLKWVLVTLTFECAIRVGMYASLINSSWSSSHAT
ncbi:MAG TPA: hypothetical protein PLN52_13410 [Opitutaceae bacterium]|nr:hypothetical protein [Opitutaceae bacterium]